MLTTVQTPRLVLVPFTAERIAAAVSDRRRLEELIAATIPSDWPGPDLVESMPMLAAVLARWGALVIDVEDRLLVGDVGFRNAPTDDGSLEITFVIVPSRRRRGYATEAVRALTEWVLRLDLVRRVIGECEPENAAAIAVFERAGFSRVESGSRRVRFERLKKKRVA